MNKPLLLLAVLFCLVNGLCFAQQPGSVQWTTITDPSIFRDSLHSIKLQTDGKVVVAGNSYHGSYMAIALGRYNGNKLDSSFGTNGIVTTWLDSAHTSAQGLELQTDGKIVVAGSYRKGTVSDFMLARYKPDGSPDSSFGINGIVRTDIDAGFSDAATALSIQPDGKIVAAGSFYGSQLAVCRYKAEGSLDSSFDGDGKLIVGSAPPATCMALQTDGKILAGCGTIVVRLMADGTVDTSFGATWAAGFPYGCYGLTILNDGKILVTGGGFVLQRLDTTGMVDNSFGTNGTVITTAFYNPNRGQTAQWVRVQSDGHILAGGSVRSGILGSYSDFAIARYKSNGAPDSSFGVLWKVTTLGNPGLNNFALSYAATINNNNELVVAGITADAQGSQSRWAVLNFYLGPSLAVPAVPGAEVQITIAPNPAGDDAHLQSKNIENGNWHLSLYDLTGRTLYSETVVVKNNALDKSISLMGLPAAMYLVKLDNGISRMTVSVVKSR